MSKKIRSAISHGTVFIGCGFAAKYPEGGGNFSVPLQYACGLKRLGLPFRWLELMPACGNPDEDARRIRVFARRMGHHGLGEHYALLLNKGPEFEPSWDTLEIHGVPRRRLLEEIRSGTILNLSYSIRPPLLLDFPRRLFINADPSEIGYYMQTFELGQSHHHEFWTLALNIHNPDCRLPDVGIRWKTFFPLVDTTRIQPQPAPARIKFTTVGQWYWLGHIAIDGVAADYSKKARFEPYMDLPRLVPEADFEMAMNMGREDPEVVRIRSRGWKLVFPHSVAGSPQKYVRYLSEAGAEFTPVKVDDVFRTGWLSDRAAVFLALGRPVVTVSTGAESFLPAESGFLFINDLPSAVEAARKVARDWPRLSRAARATAVEHFDAGRNLRKILAG